MTRGKGRRRVTEKTTATITAFVITSLTLDEITAAELASYVQGRWTIENRVRWVRDVTFHGDASQVRTGPPPRATVTLRNITIGLICLAGHTRIGPTLRRIRHDTALLIAILGLENPT